MWTEIASLVLVQVLGSLREVTFIRFGCSMLVVSTAGVGFVMGSGEIVEWTGLVWTTGGTMMAAASANAFNQVAPSKLPDFPVFSNLVWEGSA